MKIKKYLYIFSYIISIVIITILNIFSVTDVLDKRLNLKLIENPILFFLIDGLIIFVIMHYLKKEPYKLQQEVLKYFKSTNNLFLFIALLFSCSFLVIPINLFINYILITYLRPLTKNKDEVNGVEEYFNKYPEKNHHHYYNNKEEIKDAYNKLKDELDVEIPILDIEVRKNKKDKKNKILINSGIAIIIIIIFSGLTFSIIEVCKTFSRAQYNYFEITINSKSMNIRYNEQYKRIVIPLIYRQEEGNDFTNNKDDQSNYLSEQNQYLLQIKEYECYNDKNNRVSCGTGALVENRKEIESTSNNIEISYNNKKVYKGKYIENITEYLQETGTYQIVIYNQKKYYETQIEFSLSINELEIDD